MSLGREFESKTKNDDSMSVKYIGRYLFVRTKVHHPNIFLKKKISKEVYIQRMGFFSSLDIFSTFSSVPFKKFPAFPTVPFGLREI